MTLELQTDTILNISLSNFLSGFFSYENYSSSGDLTNEFDSNGGVSTLLEAASPVEPGTGIIESVSGDYANGLHQAQDFPIGEIGSIIAWVDNVDLSGTHVPISLADQDDKNKIELLIDGGEAGGLVGSQDNFLNITSSIPDDGPHLLEVHWDKTGVVYRVNNTDVADQGFASLPIDTSGTFDLTFGGRRGNTFPYKGLLDQALVVLGSNFLESRSTWVYNGGKGRTKQEFEDEFNITLP